MWVMCVIQDSPNDPDGTEPGRESNSAIQAIGSLIKSLRTLWFILIPLLFWAWHVEAFILKGDRQTAAMSLEQHEGLREEYHRELTSLKAVINDMAKDVSYIKGVIDAQDKAGGKTP